MASYGPKSLQVRSELHPDLQTVFNAVLELGYDHSLVEGYRTKARQHSFVIAVPPLSKVDYPTVHNTRPCWAVDSYPFMEGHIEFGNTPEETRQCHNFAGYVMGVADMLLKEGKITHRLRNGDDWDGDKNINDQTFMDICHFELIPLPGDTLHYFET
jgi:peptidoglycan LD-endopeptidase CwlK